MPGNPILSYNPRLKELARELRWKETLPSAFAHDRTFSPAPLSPIPPYSLILSIPILMQATIRTHWSRSTSQDERTISDPRNAFINVHDRPSRKTLARTQLNTLN